MGSLRFGGIVFSIYSHDHLSRHVHGSYAGIEVIVELRAGVATLADRRDAVDPANVKRSHVAFVVRAANRYLAELNRLWEEIHDKA